MTTTTLLHIDASPRSGRSGAVVHGSHSRRLSHHFVSTWQAARPHDEVIYRDFGTTPPQAVTGDWIHSAYTPAEAREAWMHEVLAESDAFIAELRRADVIVMGTPMYNFSAPATVKAWIDNIVRVGETFDMDPGLDDPYVPLLAERPRRTVLLTAHGSSGFGPGGMQAHLNFLVPGVKAALGLVGLREVHDIAVEHAEDRGDLLDRSMAEALSGIEQLVRDLQTKVQAG